jgi:hypothetical protein
MGTQKNGKNIGPLRQARIKIKKARRITGLPGWVKGPSGNGAGDARHLDDASIDEIAAAENIALRSLM